MWLIGAKSGPELLNWPLGSWLWFLVAMVCLVVLIWLVVQLIARVNKDSDPAEADREMLFALSDLHREGDLTAEEFRSIKSQLVNRLSSNDSRFSVIRKTAETASAETAESEPETELKTTDPTLTSSGGSEPGIEESSSSETDLPSMPEQDNDDTSQKSDQKQTGSQ